MQSPRLDNPPQPPPSVAAQMGSLVRNGIQQRAQSQAGSEPPGSMQSVADANPRGALIVKVNAIEKVAKEIAQQHESMAPFVERAMNILKQGMNETLAQPNQQSTEPPQSTAPFTPEAAGARKPLEGHANAGFVG